MELAVSDNIEKMVPEAMEESLRRLAEGGITHVHWCAEWGGEYLYSQAEMEQIRGWFDKYGLKAKSLHAAHGGGRKSYISMNEYNRIAGVELIKNRVDLAHTIGATEMVLHLYLPYERFDREPEFKEVFYAQVCRSFDEVMPYCLEKKVRICLENLFEAYGELQIEFFDRLLKKYPADFLGLCIDTGHANLVWGKAFVKELVEPFKDRIYTVHLHDNRGWGPHEGCGDAHRIPGDPAFPWKEFMDVLKTSSYEYPLILEVFRDRDQTWEDFLGRAKAAGEWLYSL